jgi:hypothetical protein
MSGDIDRIAAPFEPEAPEIIFTRMTQNPQEQKQT